MKYILLLSFLFFCGLPTFSKCAGSGIFISNTTTVLNKNGFIILEFYGNSQTLIPELNKKYPVYLKSSEGSIALAIKQIYKGGFRLTQVILIPEAPLNELLAYEFRIDKLPKEESKPSWGKINRLYNEKKIIFTVTALQKNMPSFTGAPAEQKKTFARYGCGPAKWVYFGIILSDTSSNLIKVSVKSKIAGNITEYILPVENSTVKIGHGMCSGAFEFNEENYEIIFSILDIAGKEVEKTKPLAFSAPAINTNEE